MIMIDGYGDGEERETKIVKYGSRKERTVINKCQLKD